MKETRHVRCKSRFVVGSKRTFWYQVVDVVRFPAVGWPAPSSPLPRFQVFTLVFQQENDPFTYNRRYRWSGTSSVFPCGIRTVFLVLKSVPL